MFLPIRKHKYGKGLYIIRKLNETYGEYIYIDNIYYGLQSKSLIFYVQKYNNCGSFWEEFFLRKKKVFCGNKTFGTSKLKFFAKINFRKCYQIKLFAGTNFRNFRKIFWKSILEKFWWNRESFFQENVFPLKYKPYSFYFHTDYKKKLLIKVVFFCETVAIKSLL